MCVCVCVCAATQPVKRNAHHQPPAARDGIPKHTKGDQLVHLWVVRSRPQHSYFMIQQKAASFGLEGLLCRRGPGVLASVSGFRVCIWCFHLNMARHPGS